MSPVLLSDPCLVDIGKCIVCNQVTAQLFIAGQKHPYGDINHTHIASIFAHFPCFFHEYSTHVTFGIRVICFYIIRKFIIHATGAHIRRVRHHHVVFLRHNLRLPHQREDCVQSKLTAGGLKKVVIISGADLLKPRKQGTEIHGRHVDDAAVLLRVGQIVRDIR